MLESILAKDCRSLSWFDVCEELQCNNGLLPRIQEMPKPIPVTFYVKVNSSYQVDMNVDGLYPQMPSCELLWGDVLLLT